MSPPVESFGLLVLVAFDPSYFHGDGEVCDEVAAFCYEVVMWLFGFWGVISRDGLDGTLAVHR